MDEKMYLLKNFKTILFCVWQSLKTNIKIISIFYKKKLHYITV